MAGQAAWRPSRLAIGAWGALAAAALLQSQRVAPISHVLGAAIYFIVWWVCLFAVLPIGVRNQSDTGEMVRGTSAGAPVKPRLGFVAALTTIVATVVFAALLLALRYKVVPLE